MFLQSKRTDNLKLHRAASRGGRGNEMIQCLNGCSSSRCRESCLKRELSDEEIVERTQRCHNDCKDEPEELIQMCIQKCTYYLMDPVEHSLEEEEESTSTDAGGLLPDSPHLRTRIRLIGPDGLPVISTVYDDDDQAAEVGGAVGSATESATTSDTWTPAYRVRILNDAAGHAEQLGWVLWCAVVALCLALYA
ncbi:hypothetical protein EV175_005880 [Coemansia sp. RSA 1933]|nr:hypothetical protein EV175_005880 [Coemansia sp. RSA 1933]